MKCNNSCVLCAWSRLDDARREERRASRAYISRSVSVWLLSVVKSAKPCPYGKVNYKRKQNGNRSEHCEEENKLGIRGEYSDTVERTV